MQPDCPIKRPFSNSGSDLGCMQIISDERNAHTYIELQHNLCYNWDKVGTLRFPGGFTCQSRYISELMIRYTMN